MAGNVSEWTESSYDKGSYNFDSGLILIFQIQLI